MHNVNSKPIIPERVRHIESSVYETITKLFPIPSVEAVVLKNNKLLFLKRNNEPVKGHWWFPGGRIRRGEAFEEALYREVREETGLEVIKSKFIGAYSRIFTERHDISIAYLCKCNSDNIILNGEHSAYKYSRPDIESIHPYLKQVIHDLKKCAVKTNLSAWSTM